MRYVATRDELLELIETPDVLYEWCGTPPVQLFFDEERIAGTCVIARMLSDVTGGEAYVNYEGFAIPADFEGSFSSPAWISAFIRMIDDLPATGIVYITPERCRALAKQAYENGYVPGGVLA